MLLRKRRRRSEVSFEQDLTLRANRVSLTLKIQVLIRSKSVSGVSNALSFSIRSRAWPSLRAPIILQTVHEHSLKDIARELEITEAAVKARLHRARARLVQGPQKAPKTLVVFLPNSVVVAEGKPARYAEGRIGRRGTSKIESSSPITASFTEQG